MKRIILLLFCMLAMSHWTSAQKLKPMPHLAIKIMKGDAGQHPQARASARVAIPEGQIIVGIDNTDEYSDAPIGFNQAFTFEAATYIPQAYYAGQNGLKVNAVRFALASNATVNSINIYGVGADGQITRLVTQPLSDSSCHSGWTTVELESPLTIDESFSGLFVSYETESIANTWPYATFTPTASAPLYFYGPMGEDGETGWFSGGTSDGHFAIQLICSSDGYAGNAVNVLTCTSSTAAVGRQQDIQFTLQNAGQDAVSNIDYTLTLGSESVSETSSFATPLSAGFGSRTDVTCHITPTEAGMLPLTFKVNKINGASVDLPAASYELKVVTREAPRMSVVEEFTGTQCQWCPRGWVGMERVRNELGEKAAVIAIHQFSQADPMYVDAYHTPAFTGAPTAMIDRHNNFVDAYWGANKKGIVPTVEDYTADLPEVDITVNAAFIDTDRTRIDATAVTEYLYDLEGSEIVFVLTADGLRGTTQAWKQSNGYYNQNAADQGLTQESDPELYTFCKGQSRGQSYVALTYNDVMIGSSWPSPTGANNAVTATTGKMTTTGTSHCTLSLPARTVLHNAIDKDQLYVTAMVIKADGTIANAARCHVASTYQALAFDKETIVVPEGGTTTLSPQFKSTETDEDPDLVWQSSDTSVATVDEDGTVTAVTEGESLITVALSDNLSVKASYRVVVIASDNEASEALLALVDQIQSAQALYDSSVEGDSPYQYATGSRAALLAAIQAANAAIDPTMSREALDDCSAALQAAVRLFEDAQNPFIDKVESYVIIENKANGKYATQGVLFDNTDNVSGAKNHLYTYTEPALACTRTAYTSKYDYRIEAWDVYQYDDDDNTWAETEAAPFFIWELIPAITPDEYYIRNYETKQYIGLPRDGRLQTYVQMTKDPVVSFRFIESDNYPGLYAIASEEYPNRTNTSGASWDLGGLHAPEDLFNVVAWDVYYAASQWSIRGVDQSLLDLIEQYAPQHRLNRQLGKLINEAETLINESTAYDFFDAQTGQRVENLNVYDTFGLDGLVTDVAQLSSNSIHEGDGQGLAGLLDSNFETFYHSGWIDDYAPCSIVEVENPETGDIYEELVYDKHYIQLDLRQAYSAITVKWFTRGNGNIQGRITTTAIYGSKDGEDFTPVATSEFHYTPFDEANNITIGGETKRCWVGVCSLTFDDKYRYIRLEHSQPAHGQVRPWMNGSELRVYEGDLYKYAYDTERSDIELMEEKYRERLYALLPTAKDEYANKAATEPTVKEMEDLLAMATTTVKNKTIALDDNMPYELRAEKADVAVQYSRPAITEAWEALYLPFSVKRTEIGNNFDVASVENIRPIDTDGDGVYDRTEVEGLLVTQGELTPNTLYLIRAKVQSSLNINAQNAGISPAKDISENCSTLHTNYSLYGVYSPASTVLPADKDLYTLTGGQLVPIARENVHPYRWYVTISEKSRDEGPTMIGDVNGDKRVTITDVSKLVEILIGK